MNNSDGKKCVYCIVCQYRAIEEVQACVIYPMIQSKRIYSFKIKLQHSKVSIDILQHFESIFYIIVLNMAVALRKEKYVRYSLSVVLEQNKSVNRGRLEKPIGT